MKIHASNRMPKQIVFALFVLGVTAFVSCNKNEAQEESISTEEAVEIMSESVTPESGGVVAQLESASMITSELAYLPYYCGVSKDSAIADASDNNGAVSWSYSLNWNWLMNCNNGMPDQFDFAASGSSSYNGPKMSSSHTTSATLQITGFELSSAGYLINETFVRAGTHASKIGRKLSFASETTFTVSEAMVDKLTGKIVSGIAELTVKGTNSKGKAFIYNATVTFNGNRNATLVLKNGLTFLIQW